MTEQLLAQQLESPSGTGRVEPRSDHQPDSPHQQATGSQQAEPILTGSSALPVVLGERVATSTGGGFAVQDLLVTTATKAVPLALDQEREAVHTVCAHEPEVQSAVPQPVIVRRQQLCIHNE